MLKRSLLTHVVFFLMGCMSWGLWALRTEACVNKLAGWVSLLVFVEEVLALLVFYYLLKWKSISGAVLYAIGGALGAYLATKYGLL